VLREILLALLAATAAPADGPDEARRLLQKRPLRRGAGGLRGRPQEGRPGAGGPGQGRARPRRELAGQGEGDKALEAVLALAREQPQNADLAAMAADLKLSRGDWTGAQEHASQAIEAGPEPRRGEVGRGPPARGPRRERQGRRGLEVVSSTSNTRARRRSARTPGAPDRRAGVGALLPGDGAGGRAVGRAQRRDQRDLRGGAAGRPPLLAGPLARGAAVPLGVQRGRGRQGARAGLADQPAGRRGAGHARPADLQGTSSRRTVEGRAGAGDQPEVRPGPRAAGRPEHLRRAVRRRPGRLAQGGGREPARPGGAGAAGGVVPAPGRPGRRGGGRGRWPWPTTPARDVLRGARRAAGRSAEVPLGRARLPARRRGRPEAGRRPLGLGMLYMQIGRENEANDLFKAAFAADPFNVRANNQMLVLKHMVPYKAIETAHYSVLVDPKQDELLGKYMGATSSRSTRAHLAVRLQPPRADQDRDHEGPQVVQRADDRAAVHPHRRGLARARSWPWPAPRHGQAVQLGSGPEARGRARHHLQQTDFNIPHWYTEALAVESEGFPGPRSGTSSCSSGSPRGSS